MRQMREHIRSFSRKLVTKQLDGIGIIEIILILVVIIGLILIFRNQIQGIIQAAFDTITNNSETINTEITIE